MMWLFRVLALLLLTATSALAIEQPGPSAALLANPTYSGGIGLVYVCVTNYYVNASTGSDSNSGTTPTTAWLTIQHADSSSRQPGDCINVAAGTYTWTSTFSPVNTGNAATPTGYVTYRCEVLNQCLIVFDGTYMGTNSNPVIASTTPYLIIDGFDIDGGEAFMYGGIATVCIDTSRADTTTPSHHLWVLNNKIHGCGLSCVSYGDSEWFFTIHNTVTDCSWTSVFQGSAIDYVILKRLGSTLNPYPPYTPTQYDSAFAPFHNIVSWNRVYNNGCATCLGIVTTVTNTGNTSQTQTLALTGGSGTTATFTGSISNNILTVTGISGTISVGDLVSTPGVPVPPTSTGLFQLTFITPFGSGGTSGTGGNGTYFLTIDYGSSITGSQSMQSSSYGQGMLVTGPGVQPFTYISSAGGSPITLTKPTTTTQSGGTFDFIIPGGGHTDGQGIIFDTLCGAMCGGNGDPYDYPDAQSLVSFNEIQFNNGKGMEIFGAYYIVTMNNSFFHNGTDLFYGGNSPDIFASGEVNSRWDNNIIYTVDTLQENCVGQVSQPCNAAIIAGDGRGITASGNTWLNNITVGGAVAFSGGDTGIWSKTLNKQDVDPLYTDETNLSLGNLQLQFPASPAIDYANGSAFPFLPRQTTDAGAWQTGGIRLFNWITGPPEFTGSLDTATLVPVPTPLSCSQANTFLARVSGMDRTHVFGYQNLICGMVADGTWCGALFDAIYVFETANAAAANLNLCSTNYTLTANGSPTFTPDLGYTGVSASTTVWLDPGVAANALANYSQNEAHISAWVMDKGVSSLDAVMGVVYPSPSVTWLFPSIGGTVMSGEINDNTEAFPEPNNKGSNGWFLVARSAVTTSVLYQNAIALATEPTTSAAPPPIDIAILGINNFGTISGGKYTLGAATIGGYLTAAQVKSVCHRLNVFLNSVNSSVVAANTC